MVNKPKIKGTKAESAVVAYLREHGFPWAERRALTGNKDRGDVSGVPTVVIEVKDVARDGLPGWVNEMLAEVVNDNAEHGVVVHKRKGKGDPGEWYATMTLAQLTKLLRQAGVGSPLPVAPAVVPIPQDEIPGMAEVRPSPLIRTLGEVREGRGA